MDCKYYIIVYYIILYHIISVFKFEAKIDGHWGRWTSWSTCSKSCDQGQLTRTRICNDPAPKNGGADCVGTATEANVCRKKSCFVGPDDCEFESDLCVWTNEATADQLDWTRHAGTTPSSNTGPSGDHTGLGHGNINLLFLMYSNCLSIFTDVTDG